MSEVMRGAIQTTHDDSVSFMHYEGEDTFCSRSIR